MSQWEDHTVQTGLLQAQPFESRIRCVTTFADIGQQAEFVARFLWKRLRVGTSTTVCLKGTNPLPTSPKGEE